MSPATLGAAACNNSNAVLKLKAHLGSDLSGETDAVMTNNAFTWNVPCMPGKSLLVLRGTYTQTEDWFTRDVFHTVFLTV